MDNPNPMDIHLWTTLTLFIHLWTLTLTLWTFTYGQPNPI